MRGSIGLVIGVAVGAGAMYLVLHPPWGPRVATVASSGPPVVVVASDTGVAKPKPKQRRSRSPGATAATGDPEPEEIAVPTLTAGDRALEWRGDAVALPAQAIDIAAGGAGGAGGDARRLDDSEIVTLG